MSGNQFSVKCRMYPPLKLSQSLPCATRRHQVWRGLLLLCSSSLGTEQQKPQIKCPDRTLLEEVTLFIRKRSTMQRVVAFRKELPAGWQEHSAAAWVHCIAVTCPTSTEHRECDMHQMSVTAKGCFSGIFTIAVVTALH